MAESSISSKRKVEYLFFFCFYFASYWLILLNQGVFWDDWVIYQVAPEWRMSIYDESGRPFFGYFFNALFFLTEDVWLGKVLIFCVFFIPMICLNEILLRLRFLACSHRFFIILFFGLFPVTSSRILITVLQYGLSYCLFFIAFYLTVLHSERGSKFIRILSLILFYLSFNTDSLLAFYLLVLLYLGYRHFDDVKSIRSAARIAVFHLDYILLPIGFFVIKLRYFEPYGLYEDYNKISLDGLIGSPILMWESFYQSFYLVGVDCFILVQNHGFLVLLPSVAIAYLMYKLSVEKPESYKADFYQYISRIFFGLVVIALGLFPYSTIGQVAQNNDWASRHQLLVPLGAALIIVYSVETLFLFLRGVFDKLGRSITNFVKLVLYSAIIVTFTLRNNVYYLDYLVDWYAQTSLMKQFSKTPQIREGRSFLFEDGMTLLRANGRYLRDYEYSGMFKEVFGDEYRFGSNRANALANQENIELVKRYDQYNISQFQYRPFQFKVILEQGTSEIGRLGGLELFILKLCDKKAFDQKLDNLVHLRVEMIEVES